MLIKWGRSLHGYRPSMWPNPWCNLQYKQLDRVSLSHIWCCFLRKPKEQAVTFHFMWPSYFFLSWFICSIDHLLSILVNNFLPHYRFWSQNDTRPSKDHVQVTRQGHDLWSADNVIRRRSRPDEYKVYYIEHVSTCSFQVSLVTNMFTVLTGSRVTIPWITPSHHVPACSLVLKASTVCTCGLCIGSVRMVQSMSGTVSDLITMESLPTRFETL